MKCLRFCLFIAYCAFLIVGCGSGGGQQEGVTTEGASGLGEGLVSGVAPPDPAKYAVSIDAAPSDVAATINRSLSTAISSAQVLDVPWLSQMMSYPYNTAESDRVTGKKNCGPASYLMVESFYKGSSYRRALVDETEPNRLYDIDGAQNDLKAILDWLQVQYGSKYKYSKRDNYCGSVTSITQIAEMAVLRGKFNAATYHIANMDDIITILGSHHPIIVGVDTNMAGSVPHFMVLVGYDKESGFVTVNDPGRSWEHWAEADKYGKYSIKAFEKCFSSQNNACVLIYPPDEPLPLGVVVNSTNLPEGVVGSYCKGDIRAGGGIPPYKYELFKNSLPNGMTLSSKGDISGAPTEAGDFKFVVKITDAANNSSNREGGQVFA